MTRKTLVGAVLADSTRGTVIAGSGSGVAATNGTASAATSISINGQRSTHNQADVTFAQQMIQHHHGAIEMARTELAQGYYADAKALAQKIITDQQAQINEMQSLQPRLNLGGRAGCGGAGASPRPAVLVANGAHDVTVDASNSFAMAQRLSNATTVLYSDSGHGLLFQHPDEFARIMLDFLR